MIASRTVSYTHLDVYKRQILNGNRISQFIVGKQNTVAVINIAAGSFDLFCFLNLKFIFVGIDVYKRQYLISLYGRMKDMTDVCS